MFVFSLKRTLPLRLHRKFYDDQPIFAHRFYSENISYFIKVINDGIIAMQNNGQLIQIADDEYKSGVAIVEWNTEGSLSSTF